MHLEFSASEVIYTEAIGGEIVQAIFQEFPDLEIDYSKGKQPMPEPHKYVMFSAGCEFPPYDPTVEWSDGIDWYGGKAIKAIKLTANRLWLLLENDISIDVSFKTDDITLKNIERFLLGCKS